MRARVGFGMVLSAAMVVGCNHMTPQQKAEQDQQKHAQAMQKQAHDDAVAQQKAKDQGKPYADDKLEVVGYPYIQPENRQTLLDQQAQAMSVAGARQDATLYDADFDGGELNSIGRGKVALMLNGISATRAMTIYIFAGSADNVMQARQASVDKMLHDSYAGDQVAVKTGGNPALSTPAAPGLAALKQLAKDQATREQAQSQRTGSGSGSDTTTTGQ